MSKKTIPAENRERGSDVSALYEAVALGKREAAELYAGRVFAELRNAGAVDDIRGTYIDIYIQILIRSIRQNDADRLKNIARIAVCTDRGEIEGIIAGAVRAVTAENAPEYSGGYSSLIRKTVGIINDNIGNEQLSLRWIAGNILYTNVDYLGKLFKKETGQNFSHYVMERRMKLAMKLLGDGSTDKIYEAAEKVGYGTNSQYFSQVFKKYTGLSPLEYKEGFKKNK